MSKVFGKFQIGDLVHFAHLSGNEPGTVELSHYLGHAWTYAYLVRWPDGSGTWHRQEQLRHACGAYNPFKEPDQPKLQLTLLPWDALSEVCLVFQNGAAKYAPNDWAKPDNGGGDHLDAALRHIAAHLSNEKIDDASKGGSGLRHLSHAAARLLMAIGKEIRNAD